MVAENILKGIEEMSDLYIRITGEAFENAIAKGMINPENFMYMYSKDGQDYFKHVGVSPTFPSKLTLRN